jgi:hypothetical protein
MKPRPIPKIVKDACLLMIYGDPGDEDAVPVDFISAAKSVGMRPQTLRRYLTRPEVVRFLRTERRAFREAICAGNEGALRRVRDTSPNGMAIIGSVRALEQLTESETRHPVAEGAPVFAIQIVTNGAAVNTIPPRPQPLAIDIEPARTTEIAPPVKREDE